MRAQAAAAGARREAFEDAGQREAALREALQTTRDCVRSPILQCPERCPFCWTPNLVFHHIVWQHGCQCAYNGSGPSKEFAAGRLGSACGQRTFRGMDLALIATLSCARIRLLRHELNRRWDPT